MALKIVGRSPRQISEHRQQAAKARGLTMQCDTCQRRIHVAFPHDCTQLDRQRIIKSAVDEHRRIGCVQGMAEDGRSYKIWYPRA